MTFAESKEYVLAIYPEAILSERAGFNLQRYFLCFGDATLRGNIGFGYTEDAAWHDTTENIQYKFLQKLEL